MSVALPSSQRDLGGGLITRGLLDELDPAARLTAFVPDDALCAGCTIEVGGGIADEGLKRLEVG